MTLPRAVGRTFGFAAAYLAAAYLGRLAVMDDADLSLVSPATGVAAVWFVLRGPTHRWVDGTTLALAVLVVNLATGSSPLLAVFLVVANLVQAVVFAALLRRRLPDRWAPGSEPPLTRLGDLWTLVAAAVLSTACGTLIGPTGVWIVEGEYSWPVTAVWVTRNVVSVLVISSVAFRVLPLLDRRGRSRTWAGRAWSRRAEYAAVVIVSVAAYVVAFGITHGLPLAFPLLVVTVWAGLRLPTLFVAVHGLAFGSLTVLFTLHGDGPFATIASHTVQVLVAQAFVGMVAIVGLVLALSRDERVRLLADLCSSERAATEQARLLTAIVDCMSEGLTVTDPDGRFLLRNPAAGRLLGTVPHGPPAGLFHPDGTPLEPDQLPYRRALATGQRQTTDVVVRTDAGVDGRVLHVSATPIPGDLDGHRYVVSIFHDVTDERRHRDELASFAGIVAHDLLNPLTTVQGWSETVVELLADAPEHPAVAATSDGVTRIRRAATRMRALIDDLLAYTLARDSALAATDVDLREVVSDIVVARIDQAYSGNRPAPRFDLGALDPVRGDRVLLRQLLDNLISNAIKYTAPGVTPEIRIASTLLGDGAVCVEITDNGIGIPAGHHDSIFDNFHRAHRSAPYSGTGLGLGICKRIVERHGGTLTVRDNRDGPGSTFAFTLPAAHAAARNPVGGVHAR